MLLILNLDCFLTLTSQSTLFLISCGKFPGHCILHNQAGQEQHNASHVMVLLRLSPSPSGQWYEWKLWTHYSANWWNQVFHQEVSQETMEGGPLGMGGGGGGWEGHRELLHVGSSWPHPSNHPVSRGSRHGEGRGKEGSGCGLRHSFIKE